MPDHHDQGFGWNNGVLFQWREVEVANLDHAVFGIDAHEGADADRLSSFQRDDYHEGRISFPTTPESQASYPASVSNGP